MHKETLRAIEGIGLYPVISLVIFVLFFITMFLWVLRMRKSEAEEMAAMPLDDGDTPTPIRPAPEGTHSHG